VKSPVHQVVKTGRKVVPAAVPGDVRHVEADKAKDVVGHPVVDVVVDAVVDKVGEDERTQAVEVVQDEVMVYHSSISDPMPLVAGVEVVAILLPAVDGIEAEAEGVEVGMAGTDVWVVTDVGWDGGRLGLAED